MASRASGPVMTPQRDYPPPKRSRPDPLDDWSAAHVLASFNKFPIKTSNDRADIAESTLNANGKRPALNDPLSADINAASHASENNDLPSTLVPFLHQSPFSSEAPGASGLSNCPGVVGIGGAMVPGGSRKAQYERLGRLSINMNTPPVTNGITTSLRGTLTRQNSNGVTKTPSPANKESAFKTTFQFVVNEDAKEARNTVRKHVMREYRRRERWQQELKKEDGDDGYDPTATGEKRRRKHSRPSSDSEPITSRDETAASASTSESGETGDISIKAKQSVIPGSGWKRRRIQNGNVIHNGSDGRPPIQLFGLVSEAEEAIHELGGVKGLPYQADPWAEVAVSDIDPFSRLCLQLGPATQSLLHHFAWVMPSLMDEVVTGTVFRRVGWLYANVAVHDPTPVHVILGFTAGHLANLRGRPEPAFATEHKSKAIQLINERINDPAEALSDGTIGAIVNVAGWELIDCHPSSFALHMSGIHRIVMTRGGMGSLAHNLELETVLVRLDAIRAYSSISAPRYPAFASVRALPPLAIPIPSPYSPTMPDPMPQPFEHIFCADALHLVHDIEDILLLIRAGAYDALIPVGAPFKTLLSTHVAQLLARSSSLLLSARTTEALPTQNPSPTSPNTPRPPPLEPAGPSRRQRLASRTLRLAALLFVDLAVCELFDAPPPPPNARRRTPGVHARRLKDRFLGPLASAARGATPWGRSLEMAIAVLLQADRLSLEKPWRAWYFADALTLTMALGADAWAAVARTLREYLDERVREVNGSDTSPDVAVGGEQVEGLVKGEPRSRKIWDLEKELKAFDEGWGGDGE